MDISAWLFLQLFGGQKINWFDMNLWYDAYRVLRLLETLSRDVRYKFLEVGLSARPGNIFIVSFDLCY